MHLWDSERDDLRIDNMTCSWSCAGRTVPVHLARIRPVGAFTGVVVDGSMDVTRGEREEVSSMLQPPLHMPGHPLLVLPPARAFQH
jgi:hypothetical protein